MTILTVNEALQELHLDCDADGVVESYLPVIDAEILAAAGVDWTSSDDMTGLALAKGVARLKLRIWYYSLTDNMLATQLTAKIKTLQARALQIGESDESQG